jgi:hypothetical protein
MVQRGEERTLQPLAADQGPWAGISPQRAFLFGPDQLLSNASLSSQIQLETAIKRILLNSAYYQCRGIMAKRQPTFRNLVESNSAAAAPGQAAPALPCHLSFGPRRSWRLKKADLCKSISRGSPEHAAFAEPMRDASGERHRKA